MQPRRTTGILRLLAAFVLIIALTINFSGIAYAANAPASAAGKTFNISIIYGTVFALSALLFFGCCFLVKRKNLWILLLYISVFIVNGGYLALSLARDLNSALLANQLSYFGASMLPLSMLMIIIKTCRITHPKWVSPILVLISLSAFLLAASGGYSTLYYKEVSITTVNGICVLNKVYGSLHFLYTVYLLLYFGMMIAVITYASVKKTVSSSKYVIFLVSAVFGNLAVWFVEQLIYVNFEFLSVSYIATELLLLSVHIMLQDYDTTAHTDGTPTEPKDVSVTLPPDIEELFSAFSERAAYLTATERSILQYYADGYEISEVAELAFISIHTVRKHNANMYQKLGVGSRDELILYIDLFRRSGRLAEILQPPENQSKSNLI
ncbi:MAG: hypothetical protein IKL27_04245 [Oscillospiraceae bacterium]|nr:hypothetical protein [Oscillospiraceae bacterium]